MFSSKFLKCDFQYKELLHVMALYEDEFGIARVTESVMANELGTSVETIKQSIQELHEKHFVIEKIKYGVYLIHHENMKN